MDFWRAVEILSKRKWLLVLSTCMATLLTFGATRLVGSRYAATVKFITPPQTALPQDSQDFISMTPGATTDREFSKAQANTFTAIVRSRDVLEPALKKSRIHQLPNTFLKDIQFKANGARFYELEVIDSAPSRAEVLSNAIAESFVERYRSIYTQQAESAVKTLEDQLRDLDARLGEIRGRIEVYKKEKNIVTDVRDQVGNALYRLQTSRQRRDDLVDRIAETEARLQAARAELESTPSVIENIRSIDSSPLVRNLEERLGQVESELSLARIKYTEEHFEVKRLLATRDGIEARLKAERQKKGSTYATSEPNPQLAIVRRNISDLELELHGYKAQLATVAATHAEARNDIDQFTGIEGPLQSMLQEMDQVSENRASMVQRLHSARSALDVANRQNPIAIMDRVNEFNQPQNLTMGRTRKMIALAALCALLGTAGLILAFDSVDRRLRSVRQAETVLPAPVLAAIPQAIGRMSSLAMARATELLPLSIHSEAYRFLGLHLLSARGPRIRSLMVISAKAEQGSTRTATNLGITLAQAGQRVIIVDANVRSPQVHDVFDLSNDVGFTNLLQKPDDAALEEALRPTSLPNLRVITSGPPTENPWELFRSENLIELSQRLRDLADYVIYDTPSALAFTDALNLAPAVDAAFLCVRALESPSGAEQQLVELLQQSDVVVLGAVLNDVPAQVLDSFQNYQKYYPTTSDTVPVLSSRAGESGTSTVRKTRSWMRLSRGSHTPYSHGHGPSGSHFPSGSGFFGSGRGPST